MAFVLLIHGQVWWGMVCREFIEHHGGDTGICWGAQTRSGALAGLLSNAIGADFSRSSLGQSFLLAALVHHLSDAFGFPRI